MVRAFVKHSDEATEDDELASVHRDLYDYMLALGAPLKAGGGLLLENREPESLTSI